MGYPNTFHNDKWKISFSNVPSFDDSKINMRLFDEYVKSITLPDLSIEIQNIDYLAETIRAPISRTNDNLNVVTVEFIASEDLKNYFYFYEWYQMLRYHKSHEKVSRNITAKAIEVELLDNEKRPVGKLKFTEAIITSLGAFALTMGTAEEVTFSVQFIYEELKLI